MRVVGDEEVQLQPANNMMGLLRIEMPWVTLDGLSSCSK